MKELIVSGYGISIRAKSGLIRIRGKDVSSEISPSDLDSLVIVTGGISISSKAIRILIRHGVDIIFLDGVGRPLGRVYPPYINRTVITRRRQYEAYYTEKRWDIVYSFLEAKIKSQAGLLRYYAKSREEPKLKEVANEILSGLRELEDAMGDPKSIINAEAKVARLYWSGVSMLLPEELGFDGRNHDSPDQVNICLNYTYALLYGVIWKALVIAGLDPYAGYLHTDRSGKESLVFDYSEMFRSSAVDRLLIKIFNSNWRADISGGILSSDSRAYLIKSFFNWIERKVRTTSGTTFKLSQAIKRYAISLASFIRGDKKTYSGFVESW